MNAATAPTADRLLSRWFPPTAWLIERTIAVAVAFLLSRSAFVHLGNPYHFLSSVYSYNLTSIEVGQWVAMFVPWFELTLGVCLLLGWWKRPTHLLAGLLFATFTVAQVLAIRQGLRIACGCYGADDSLQVGPLTIGIAAGCSALNLLGALLARPESPPAGPADQASR